MSVRRLVFTLATLVAVTLGAQTRPPQAPSCLIITLDTLRADRLGCYGSDRGLTPSLDAFAKTATLFESAQAPTPQTLPSHATIFSGWNPDRHGVRSNLEIRLSQVVPLLPESFRSRGYATGAFISSVVLKPQYGIGRGYATYDDEIPPPPVAGKPNPDRRAKETLGRALPWLQAQKGPWFCWVHLFDPHAPYEPPPPYATQYADAPYDGEIAYMDRELGEFFAALERGGQLADTVVVICGDHGESLGEHGEDSHGVFIYQSTTRVPLLIRLPGQKAGARVAQDVGLVDIASTVREVLALPPVAGDGTSLVPLLKGQPLARPPVYLESLTPLHNYGWAPLYGAVEAHHKYILAPRPELYQLEKDPGEETNLVTQETERAGKLRAYLQGQLQRGGGAQSERVHVDDDELSALQSLGYISGTPGVAGASYRDPKDGRPVLKDLKQGLLLYEQRKYKEAAEALERVAAVDRQSPLVFFTLGRCYDEFDPARALQNYKRALQLRPSFEAAYARLLLLLINAGKFADANRIATLALEVPDLEDNSGDIHLYLAWSAFYLGKPEAEILKALDEATLANPQRDVNFRLRALLALRRGDTRGALAQLKAMAAVCTPATVAQLEGDPAFKDLREDPGFKALVAASSKRSPGAGK